MKRTLIMHTMSLLLAIGLMTFTPMKQVKDKNIHKTIELYINVYYTMVNTHATFVYNPERPSIANKRHFWYSNQSADT